MIFHHPSSWFLLLLLLLPLLWWRWSRRPRATVHVSSTELLAQPRPSLITRLRCLPAALRSAALILLIVALARPQKVNEHTRIFTEGFAIQLVVDRSGSMAALDFELDRQRTSRMEAVKHVVQQFVSGSSDLPGRAGDLIGLVTFASFADSLCPITLDHDHLTTAIKQTDVASEQEGAATAIGDALALAVERLTDLEKRTDLLDTGRIRGKVMILLTDGEHNAGDIDPLTAAEMAAAFDIRVYTIGVGTDRGIAPMPVTDPFTGRSAVRNVRVSIDERTLRRVADLTEAQYFRATDTQSLRRIYAEIDQLERTKIQQQRFSDYKELALASVQVGPLRLPSLLAAAFVLLVLESLLRHTRFRTLP